MFWGLFGGSKPARNREVFTYFDGLKARSADPIVVFRMLKDDKTFNMDVHPALVDAGDVDAIGITAAAVRSAFGVKSLDAGGLTEQECVALLLDYFAWVEDVKKKLSGPVTSPESTAMPLPPACLENPENSTPDCSSIVTGQSSDIPPA